MRRPSTTYQSPTVPEQERRGRQRSLEGGFGTGVGYFPNLSALPPHGTGPNVNAELKAHPISKRTT